VDVTNPRREHERARRPGRPRPRRLRSDFYAALLETRAGQAASPGYAKFLAKDLGLNLTLNEHNEAVPESALRPTSASSSTRPTRSAPAPRAWPRPATPVEAEEQVTCCYAVQDKFWFADPDGRAWEVYTVLADAEVAGTSTVMPAVSSGAACCAPAASGPVLRTERLRRMTLSPTGSSLDTRPARGPPRVGGARAADVDDAAQEVLLRLHEQLLAADSRS
jgi:hypothetical protein